MASVHRLTEPTGETAEGRTADRRPARDEGKATRPNKGTPGKRKALFWGEDEPRERNWPGVDTILRWTNAKKREQSFELPQSMRTVQKEPW